jgi:plasmid replication DNA-binding protein KfrA
VENATEAASDTENDYVSRQDALYRRVAQAAREIADRGFAPTVARVRAALGGGSPNDLAPALKAWKASVATAEREVAETSAIPVQIADLAQELWQRATVAATVALKGGPIAREQQAESDEAEALRGQVTSLRRELERESILYGELRAQAARHEAIARDALARLEASEARERKHLRDLGNARGHIAELAATLGQLRARPATSRAPRAHRAARSQANAKTRRPRAARNRPASAARAPIKPRNRKFAHARGKSPAVSIRKKTARVAAATLRDRR